ncbi:hypothetical protein NPIL_201891 [Nephila pilipes]|uniref:Uncharacterized protein n=1 Tax=Nephila pilipes TaxID=299642 RepID=A0A8X6P660_NEPPI|nr:hypothetical protein NPIL_201891 [Nephila pilipes]
MWIRFAVTTFLMYNVYQHGRLCKKVMLSENDSNMPSVCWGVDKFYTITMRGFFSTPTTEKKIHALLTTRKDIPFGPVGKSTTKRWPDKCIQQSRVRNSAST